MQTIPYQQLKDILAKGDAEVINVLPREAFAKEHIPGSINIPGDSPDFVQQVEDLIGGKDTPVVVYCASSSCDASKKAAKKLEDVGFTQVECYEGGTKEWQDKTVKSEAAA